MTTSDVAPNYEEMFAHRFTAEDPDYQQYVKRGEALPPILDNWRGRSGGQQRNRDQRFQDNRPFRDRGERRDWSSRPDQQWHGRGWGNNYQGHRPGQSHYSYGQQNSYNSYNQRPRQDYY
ncbi:RNA guanine-N7 methyltransferase-activating subunit-like protein [Pleurodeles waltl]|uniref:RNA guanine-N7 methyltransferase-activating subunit-like protein n=1 Tax=Pleurodeles waltl TaxID=8319 RepID=UPI003709BAC3